VNIIFQFYVHHSVHRESIPKKIQQDDTLVGIFLEYLSVLANSVDCRTLSILQSLP
jgi:hypothetical protein